MSATQGRTIVGDIIDIEHCEDLTATEPTWDLVAKTQDTVETSPNTEVADTRLHERFNLEKSATSEAWEISFSALIETGPGQLQVLGLLTDNYEEAGHVDSRDTAEALRITIYADQAAKDAGEYKYRTGIEDYLLVHDGGEVPADDYSSISFVIHSRHRPIRLGLGGSFTEGS